MSPTDKVTYTSEGVDEAVHKAFEGSLDTVQTTLGGDHPYFVGGAARKGDGRYSREMAPGDRDIVIGGFAQTTHADVDEALEVAVRGFEAWSKRPWSDRVELLRRAEASISSHRYELAALVSLEVGKPRLEALGDIDEAIELIHLYCSRMEDRDGFRIQMTAPGSGEEAVSVMRPFGPWVVIAPFNFPVPLAMGPAAAALIAGNSVLLKPSYQGYLSTIRLYELLVDAGIPTDALQLLTGDGADVGDHLVHHPDVAGVTFTGSHAVGMRILRESAARSHPRPVIAEMGGKNAAIVTRSARLDVAAEGVARGAFGFSGQKCSACSRVLVDESVADEFVDALTEAARSLRVANPVWRDVFTGPVINKAAVERYLAAVEEARATGRMIAGGEKLEGADTPSDQYVSLAVVEVPDVESRLLRDELFVPFVAVHRVNGLNQAIELLNRSNFGLTAGLFSEDPDETETFFSRAEAGVLFVNRRPGATTGAWPGVQTFGGWKGSATTGRGTGGHYYVDQYMHEQSRTIMHG